MADITHASFTENFYNVTSSTLLAQPEPQYPYAKMFLSALATDLPAAGDSDAQVGRSFVDPGAAYASADRDRLNLIDPQMVGYLNQVVIPKVDFLGLPGSMVRFNRPLFADTTYTTASRKIGLNTTISTQTITAGSEQVSLELERFAGPYDQTNSRVAPFGIDALSAQMGIHKLTSYVGTHLKRDFHKFIDSVQVALLDTASTVVRPAGMSADNDATVAGQFRLDYDTLNRAELAADNASLPTFSDGYRIFVGTPTQLSQLKTDADYIELSKVHPTMNALFPDYVASIGKLHIFKSVSLNQSVNGSSIPIHKGHLIAPGALLGGMGKPPRVAPSTDDNFGEVAKMIWVAYLAFGLADNRFVISVRSSS